MGADERGEPPADDGGRHRPGHHRQCGHRALLRQPRNLPETTTISRRGTEGRLSADKVVNTNYPEVLPEEFHVSTNTLVSARPGPYDVGTKKEGGRDDGLAHYV